MALTQVQGQMLSGSSNTTTTIQSNGTTAITIDSSQNVGIGTATPTQELHLYRSSGATDMLIEQASSGNAYVHTKNTSREYAIGTRTDALAFFDVTADAERMRIDSSGNLNINNASALSSSRVSVWNATNGSGGLGVGYGSTAGQFRIMYTLSNGVFYFDNGTNTPSLSSAGAWTNASDARLKNNITDIKYGLSTVLNTQPRSYKMNDLDGEYIGFVAQELQTVIPEVVSGDPEKQLGVDYGSLVAVAFKAIQELNAKVTALETKLAAK